MNGFDHSPYNKDKTSFDKAVNDRNRAKHTRFWIVIAIIVAAFSFVISPIYNAIMEYWQLKEIGQAYTSVFWTNLIARVATQTMGFVLIFAVLLFNSFLICSIAVKPNFQNRFLSKKWPYVLLSALLALMCSGVLGGSLYQKILLALNRESFGVSDPLFQQDVGYYVFTRPMLVSLISGGKTLLLFMMILAAVVYFLIFVKKGHQSLKAVICEEGKAFSHVAVLAIIYFILSMVTYRLSAENILFSSFGAQKEIFGAGYVEVNIWKTFYKVIPFVVLVSVLLVGFFLYRKKYWLSLFSLALVPVAFFAVGIAAAVTDSLVVSPNERNLQSPYIAYNMEATRKAFGLDAVTEREFTPQYDLTQQNISEDETWLAGTRIADFGATQTAYNQLQFLRKYYTFNDVDVAPYVLDGKPNVVFMAAREMNKENLDASAKSYANQIFRYTHGFGVVASPVNQVTAEGQPEFLIRDIPPQSTGGMPQITQPRIYYGELTNDYVVVGGQNKELDYSEGLTDVECTYDGDSGVRLSFIKRLMFSLYYKDYRLLLSGNISGDSRILINRNILDRVKKVAPFISFDDDPYLLVGDDGALYWIVNGYTYSSQYPYAQPYGNVNYIRNSVTAIVSAYTGDVSLYITDETDPIARAYQRIYPEIFDDNALPEAVKEHIRVPEYLFKVQADVYQRYHVKDAGQFYDQADVWDIAKEKYQENEITVEPYYNIMEIDGANEMVLMIPYVVQGKHNMVGLLVQRNAPDHYGEFILHRFPKNQTVYGPMQIENRVDNDPDISREMTLWGQGGSSVIRGNMLVVPYRSSLLYIEPVYITSKNNASLPELKRVIVSYGETIAMEPTLEAALRSVFAKAPVGDVPIPPNENDVIPQPQTGNLDLVISNLLEDYDRFKTATQANDWTSMGEYLAELEVSIDALRKYRETTE